MNGLVGYSGENCLLSLVNVGELRSGRLLADHRDAVWVLVSDLISFSLSSICNNKRVRGFVFNSSIEEEVKDVPKSG